MFHNCSTCDQDCITCSVIHKRCNQIIDSLVECLKEACGIINETGQISLKWKKAIIAATGKTFKIKKIKGFCSSCGKYIGIGHKCEECI